MFDPDQHRILVNDANKYIQSLVQEYGSEEHALIELVKAILKHVKDDIFGEMTLDLLNFFVFSLQDSRG